MKCALCEKQIKVDEPHIRVRFDALHKDCYAKWRKENAKAPLPFLEGPYSKKK